MRFFDLDERGRDDEPARRLQQPLPRHRRVVHWPLREVIGQKLGRLL